MVLTKDQAKEMDLPWSALEDTIIGTGRWAIHHLITFEYDGKFYQAAYSVGATEQQDEGPWEFDKEIQCVEVRRVEKLVTVWEPV